MKFWVKWKQDDYDGKRVTLKQAFYSGLERDDFIKSFKRSADYIGKYFAVEKTWEEK